MSTAECSRSRSSSSAASRYPGRTHRTGREIEEAHSTTHTQHSRAPADTPPRDFAIAKYRKTIHNPHTCKDIMLNEIIPQKNTKLCNTASQCIKLRLSYLLTYKRTLGHAKMRQLLNLPLKLRQPQSAYFPIYTNTLLHTRIINHNMHIWRHTIGSPATYYYHQPNGLTRWWRKGSPISALVCPLTSQPSDSIVHQWYYQTRRPHA